ncbi:MAG: transposase [Ruminococcus sp.]|nr:transposase [Ruminococcus sp.]
MRQNRKYSAEFKINCVKKVLEEHVSQNEISREYGIVRRNIQRWIRDYQEFGVEYFYEEHRGNHVGNPFAALHTSKSLSREERLELENLKLKIENERLKKGYMVKGVGANKEYVTTLDANTKSSKD